MKVLVTGGGGFLGTEICKQLLEENKTRKDFELISVSRKEYPHLKEMGVQTFQGDLSRMEDLALTQVETVFHTAAKAGVWGKEEEFYQNNYIATENILNWARRSGVKNFVFTSSPSVVFGKDDIENGSEDLPYPEEHLNPYSKTKAMAEELVLKANSADFKTTAIRPHLIWGEGDPHLIPRILLKAREGKLKIVGEGENLVDVIHVKNAAKAHLLAWEALRQGEDADGKAYFVGQERPVNLWEFINQILMQAGIEGVEDKIGFKSAYWLGFALEKGFKALGINSPEPPMTRFVALQLAKHHYFSQARAKEDLGYSPIVTIEEGLLSLFSDKKERLARLRKTSEEAPETNL